MLKKIAITSILVLSLILFTGCSQEMGTTNFYSATEESYNLVLLPDETAPERKIIYQVDISFDVRNLETSAETLRSLIESDEWFDEEIINSSYQSYVIRIKTERLDEFISSLEEEFTLRDYQKRGTDISLEYQDASNRVLSLEAQLDRLLELYDAATLSEMMIINREISDIEVELQQLQGTLNQFDSLADYSEVSLRFYGSSIVSTSPFINRLGNAFVDGFNAILSFFDSISIGLATISPFLVFFGAIGFVSFKVYKRRKNKTAQKTLPVEDK